MRNYSMSWGRFHLEFGRCTRIISILNVTPDSFSDGGRFYTCDAAVAQGVKMAAQGADIIDVGGESTRPNADPVSLEEECRRVIPVIEKLSRQVAIPISIDTTKAQVAQRALAAGAAMINDIGALQMDSEMATIAGRYDVPVVLMHMLGTPKTMQVDPQYRDVVADIHSFLETAIDTAVSRGVDRAKIIVDPGIGFGKTLAHNLEVIKRLGAFVDLKVPLLVGASRKSFVRSILAVDERLPWETDTTLLETATHAAAAVAVLNGAHVVRVHDVAGTLATVKMIDAVRLIDTPNLGT